MNSLLKSIISEGTYLVVSDFQMQEAITTRVRNFLLDTVEEIAGVTARQDLINRGLGYLHEYLPADDIGKVRDRLMPSLRPDLFRFTAQLGKGLLGLDEEFFVDDYTILRINFPYEVGLKAPDTAENPGIGRVDPSVKTMKSSTQVKDGVYDPKSYHKNTPPASWAHGPHKDTWTGHSRHGINIWWAMSQVVDENSMIFYPNTFGKAFQPDPKSLYLAAGYKLPKPKKMALHAGDMLIFNPEMLHATHLNTSGLTRIALSMRINPSRPQFDPSCFYAREFWHSSTNIDRGEFDVIRQFKREENFEDPSSRGVEVPVDLIQPIPVPTTQGSDGWDLVRLDSCDLSQSRILVELASTGQQAILFRSAGGWKAVQSTCPHLDTNLMDGFSDDNRIFCPAHGVCYDLSNGTSSSPILRLRTYEIHQDSQYFRIRAKA